jgi:hypothetical protein
MGRLIVIAISILGLMGWALEIRRDVVGHSGGSPTATVTSTSTGASRPETPTPSSVPASEPTRRPGSTVFPTLSFSTSQAPRPTDTPP